MNDDQRLLASAALDGDVTTEERARAEADPDVVAEIERLRAVRTAMRVEVAPDPARREAAIAAALGAFDARADTVAAPPPPAPAHRRRSRWMTPVLAAAAAVVIVVGGVVTIRSSDDDGDDAATSATAFDESPAELSATARESPAATAAEAETAADEDAGAGAEATEATSASAAGDAALPAAPAAAPLASPADITEFVRSFDESGSDSAEAAVCPGGVFVSRTSYVVDGVAVPVEVLRVDDRGEAIAVRVDTCVVVATAPLP